MKKNKILILVFAIKTNSVISQGSSTTWDAQHAFDEPHGGSSSIGVGGFFVMLLIFVIALFLWSKTMNKK